MSEKKERKKNKIPDEIALSKKICINLTNEEFEKLGVKVKERGYFTRSDYIRDLIELDGKKSSSIKNEILKGVLNELSDVVKTITNSQNK